MLDSTRGARKKIKTTTFRLIALAIGISLPLVVGELGVRLFVPVKYWARWESTVMWQLDPELGWINKPNFTVHQRSALGAFVQVRTNEDGILSSQVSRQKAPGVIRIIMLGDSLVAGLALPYDQRVSADLARLLQARGVHVEVLNAAVEGYSTDQELLRLRRLLPLYHPDIVILGICNNDFEGNEERLYRPVGGLPKPIFVLSQSGELKEIPPDLSNAAVRPYRLGPFLYLLEHSALYHLVQPAIFSLRLRWIDPNGLKKMGAESEFYYRRTALDRFDWGLFSAELREMDKDSQSGGARFVCFLAASPYEVWNPYIREKEKALGLRSGEYDRYAVEKKVASAAQEAGVSFCPLVDHFLANEQRGPFHLPLDIHYNAVGHQVTAEALEKFLLGSGVLNGRSPGQLQSASCDRVAEK